MFLMFARLFLYYRVCVGFVPCHQPDAPGRKLIYRTGEYHDSAVALCQSRPAATRADPNGFRIPVFISPFVRAVDSLRMLVFQIQQTGCPSCLRGEYSAL